MSEAYLRQIEERSAAAPKRPIHFEELQPEIWEVWKQEEECHVTYAKFYSETAGVFFCEALKDVPELIKEVRRLQAELHEKELL